ncbi:MULTISPECIES: iron chaperone [Salimicrobium]|uniref:YdhG-like domain-containing protein n=1 Tax=Salimicrobium humidisoli TaxID=2029857 RepID=A0ABX4HT32_9BACI|nr:MULTISPECIES: iron chaperone [Salimicrobium]PBB06193.1 hypothetical protein CKW00_05405 [Salimicrobium humidisoli]
METFEKYLETLTAPEARVRMEEVLTWMREEFPQLNERIAWNQPMFTDHGTYIIGFSASKKHMAVSPEKEGITHFSKEIEDAGYRHTKMLLQIPWAKPVDYKLLKRMISYNIAEKKNCTSFWR